jgi:hypothetical protein
LNTQGQNTSGCQSARGVCVCIGCKPTMFAMLVTSLPVDPIIRVAMLGTEPAWLAMDRALLTGSVAFKLPAEFDIACLTSPSEIPAKSYFVGTLNCVRCSHGIVYPPSPILKIPHVYQYPVYHFPYVGNRNGYARDCGRGEYVEMPYWNDP